MLGTVSGCAEVHLGESKVCATATAEIIEPFLDRGSEGLLNFFVDFSPMAAPGFEAGRPNEAANEMMRLLERAFRKSQAIDIEALCVVAGKKVWSVRCDVVVLDHRGNITDAAILASLAALRHLDLPSVSVHGIGEDATVQVLSREQAEPQPLIFHHLPLSVSFGLFQSAEGMLHRAVDPTDREELVMLGVLSIIINQYDEVCGVHKPGGLPIEATDVLECAREAVEIARGLLGTLQAAIDDAEKARKDEAEHLRRTGRLPKNNPASEAAPFSVAATLITATPGEKPLEPSGPASALEAAGAGRVSEDSEAPEIDIYLDKKRKVY